MKRKQRGFTLIEMMLVVAILGIIAAIALPSYQGYMEKSRRSDATSILMRLASLQEQFFMDNRSYTANFMNLGFGNTTTIQSEAGYYAVTITVPTTGFSYELTATPQGVQAGDTRCANFTLNSNGTRGATGTEPDICW